MKIPFQPHSSPAAPGHWTWDCRKLAREGVKKIAVITSPARTKPEKTLAQLRDAGADGILVQGDTSNASRAEILSHEAARKLGGCDIFVQSVIPRGGHL